MIVLNSQQMNNVDRLTVERCGISYEQLMENAGAHATEIIVEQFSPIKDKRVVVLCGKGNNGGDGLVIARLLQERDAIVNTYFLDKQDVDKTLLRGSNIIVDAILGTGLSRPAEGRYESIINSINEVRGVGDGVKIVSIDIPSGLSANTGEIIGPHVRADLTITFTSPKIGNVMSPACISNGELVIASIGSPRNLILEQKSNIALADRETVKFDLWSMRRAPDAHKGNVGHVFIIGGSRGKTGAIALTSEAALRSGCGLVTAATAKSALPLLISQCRNEIMTEELEDTAGGGIAYSSLNKALEIADKCDVIAIGPGLLSLIETTKLFVKEFIQKRTKPIIIDADGLNALAPWPADLKGSLDLPIIITPHPGEMARLIGMKTKDITKDPIDVARKFAANHDVIVVLKGHRTVTATPQGFVTINSTGNAGMATGGSGDVLTGIIAGLLAQSQRTDDLVIASAVYLHGLAGDLAARKLGMRSLIASDIISHLSEAIIDIGGDTECPNFTRDK